MQLSELARRDQQEAADREFERKAKPWLLAMLAIWLLLGAYATAAALGWVPAAPWSPLGTA